MVAVAFFATAASVTPGATSNATGCAISERRQTIELSLGVSVLDRDILVDSEARLLQCLQKRGPVRCLDPLRSAAEISNNRQDLLRRCLQRHQRDRSGRAADQREELAAVHYSMTSVARARIDG